MSKFYETPRMRPEVKEQWLEALRSGEYKQGRKVLHNIAGDEETGQDTFCCLGVLCNLAYKDGAVTRETVEAYEEGDVYAYGNGAGMPSDAVVAWAYGLDTDSLALERAQADLNHGGTTTSYWLPNLNDHLDYTFKQIADVLEKGEL